MAQQQVRTELVIDARSAVAGAAQYQQAMDAARSHIDRLVHSNQEAQVSLDKSAQVLGARVPQSVNAVTNALIRLQSTYDPLIAKQAQLEREMVRSQAVIDRAVQIGVIDQARATDILERLRARQITDIERVRDATLAANTAVRQSNMAMNDNLPMRGGGAFQTANVAAQFQDIGVTAAMGMNPLMIGLQQGAQLSAVLGPMGAAGAVRGLAAAFTSLINPVSLVTVGLTAAAAAAIQWAMSTEDEVGTLEEVLKAHEASIAAIKGRWGEAASGVEAYAARSRAAIQAQNILIGADLTERMRQATRDLVSGGDLIQRDPADLNARIVELQRQLAVTVEAEPYARIEGEIARLMDQLDDVSTGTLRAARDFGVLTPAVDAFAESVRNGSPDFIRLQEAISRELVADPTNKALQDLVREINSFIEAGVQVQSAAEANASAFDLIGSSAERNARRLDAFTEAMASLSKISAPAQSDRERAALEYDAAMRAAIGWEDARAAAMAYEAALARITAREEGARVPIPTPRPNDLERLASIPLRPDIAPPVGWGAPQWQTELRGDIFGFAQDFRSALLQNGGDIGEALGQSVLNAVLRVADRTFERAISGILDIAFGTGFQDGRGGGLAALIGYGASSAPSNVARLLAPANDNAGLPIADAGMSLYRQAIQNMESSGNYGALGPFTGGDRAYGAYQVMGSNIGPWSQAALGRTLTPAQFLRDPAAQDAVFNHVFGGYVDRFGPSGAAQAWFGGPGSVGRGGNVADILGTTGTQYVQKFNAQLQQLTGTAAQAANGLGTLGTGFSDFGHMLSSLQAQSGSGGWADGLMNMFGGASGALKYMLNISPAATGVILSGGMTGLFHDGRYPGQPGKMIWDDLSLYATAPRYHSGRVPMLAPDEERAIIRKDEPIFRSMDHARQVVGGPPVVVQNIDQRRRGEPVETQQSRGPNGEVIIRNIIRDEIASGGADKAMLRYALTPKTIARGG